MIISIVSYLNTAPLLYGIQHTPYPGDFKLMPDVPAEGAARFFRGEADLALVPVGACINQNVNIIGNFCIGATGMVRTVCVFANEPIHKISKIKLDPHSRTSVLLLQLLIRHHFKMDIEFLPNDDPSELGALSLGEAALMIGDKVFVHEKQFAYRYDLADEWVKMTGLPFVFAAWFARQTPDPDVVAWLDRAQQSGVDQITQVASLYQKKEKYSSVDVLEYFQKNISYTLDEQKRKGMQLFMQMAGEIIQNRS